MPLEHLGIPPRIAHTRALSGIYLERSSVHVCTLLCTGGYTMVYTRVYFFLLGSRSALGKSAPRAQMLLEDRLLDHFTLDPLVISDVSAKESRG